ncbi:hypothetical protein NNO_2065 [Hydrogenimonas sp.]|nr:hypothetical protein NNO_2065 [Hydrogenimonas sp.]
MKIDPTLNREYDLRYRLPQGESLASVLKYIVEEIRRLRGALEAQQARNGRSKELPDDYYRFVAALRVYLQADTDKGVYPELSYKGLRIGCAKNGLLYEKVTGRYLPRELAFEVYRYFFENRERIEGVAEL